MVEPLTTNAIRATSGQQVSQDVGSRGGDEARSLEAQAVAKLAAARTWKSYIELDVKEAYFFTAPNRQRQISSMTSPAQARMLDAPELNTDEAFIICQDFVTEIVNAFMPEAEKWVERGPGMYIPKAAWDRIKPQVIEDDGRIFDAIKASNFYVELPKAFYPDLAIGTSGIWIEPPAPGKAIQVAAVPFRELEIDMGPYGTIDYRAAVTYTRNHLVREILGDEIWAKVPAELKKLNGDRPSDRTQIVKAFWRIWEDKSDTVWQHVVMLGNRVIHDVRLRGEGSCPLIVSRFGATADWPHGVGPMIQGLPSFRQIDEKQMQFSKHASLSIEPPISFPDDSFAAIEQGLEEGMGYPIRPGTEGAIKNIYTVPPPEAAQYDYQQTIKRLRKLFFVDYPEQTGDTPPTLGQWLDEMARAQRRVGTPGLSFWREGPAEIFLRYKHLLELAGVIKPLQVDGRAIATMPRNPAQAAAEQQEVGMFLKFASSASQLFPEEWKIHVDGEKTMKAVAEKMRVRLVAWRNPDQVKQAVAAIAQLSGARHAGANIDQTPGPAA